MLFTSCRSAGASRRAPAPDAGMSDFLALGKAGAKHILLGDRSRANYLKDEIENGNMTFEAAAREYSTWLSAAKAAISELSAPARWLHLSRTIASTTTKLACSVLSARPSECTSSS